jgi:hypothetical protein
MIIVHMDKEAYLLLQLPYVLIMIFIIQKYSALDSSSKSAPPSSHCSKFGSRYSVLFMRSADKVESAVGRSIRVPSVLIEHLFSRISLSPLSVVCASLHPISR